MCDGCDDTLTRVASLYESRSIFICCWWNLESDIYNADQQHFELTNTVRVLRQWNIGSIEWPLAMEHKSVFFGTGTMHNPYTSGIFFSWAMRKQHLDLLCVCVHVLCILVLGMPSIMSVPLSFDHSGWCFTLKNNRKNFSTWRGVSSHKLQDRNRRTVMEVCSPPRPPRVPAEEEHAIHFIEWGKFQGKIPMQACSHTKVVLLSIVRMQVLAAVPLLFTALHMYSPSSSGKVSGR